MPKQMTEDQYEELANAIITRAAEDYRTALVRKSKMKIKSLERFFRSDWCHFLTSIDTEYIIERIRKESNYLE